MKRRCRKPKHTKEQNIYSWNDSTGSFLSTIEKIVNLKFYKHSVRLLRADLDPRTEVSPSVDQKRHLNYAPLAPRLRGRIRLTLFFGLQQFFNFWSDMFWLFSYLNRIGCLMMRARTIWTRWMAVKEKAPWEDQSQWMKNKAIYQLMKILRFYQKIQGVCLCPQWIFRQICVFCSQTSAHYLLLVAAIFDFETRGDLGELKVLSGSRGWVLPPSPCHLWLTLHLKVFGKPTVGVYIPSSTKCLLTPS